MELRHVFIFNAVISLVFGCILVVAPPLLLSVFGVAHLPVSPAGILLSRLFGAAILGYCLVTWFARNAPDSEARRAIVLAYFITHAIGFILTLLGQLSGMANVLGWAIVAIYLLLTLGYGYFQFVRPGTS